MSAVSSAGQMSPQLKNLSTDTCHKPYRLCTDQRMFRKVCKTFWSNLLVGTDDTACLLGN